MDEMTNITDLKNFISNNKLCVLLISSSNCGVCISVESKLDKLLENFKEVKNRKVKIEKIPEVSGEFLVFTVPTILFFINGKEVIRESRFIQFEKLREDMSRYIN